MCTNLSRQPPNRATWPHCGHRAAPGHQRGPCDFAWYCSPQPGCLRRKVMAARLHLLERPRTPLPFKPAEEQCTSVRPVSAVSGTKSPCQRSWYGPIWLNLCCRSSGRVSVKMTSASILPGAGKGGGCSATPQGSHSLPSGSDATAGSQGSTRSHQWHKCQLPDSSPDR